MVGIVVEVGLTLLDERGRVIWQEVQPKSLTYAGMDWAARALCDPVSRPPVASYLGIGYGPGANTPFDPSQTDLQGANQQRRPAIFTFDAQNRAAILEATWGVDEPETSLIYVNEIGLFDAATGGTLIDRVVVVPTPKRPEYPLRVHAAIRLVQSSVAYQFV